MGKSGKLCAFVLAPHGNVDAQRKEHAAESAGRRMNVIGDSVPRVVLNADNGIRRF